MRFQFLVAAALIVGALRAQGQGREWPLNSQARLAVLSGVLVERDAMFAQPVVIDACGFKEIVADSSVDYLARLPAAYRSSVRGTEARCMNPSEVPGDGMTATLLFQSLRYETDEYVPTSGLSVPRLPNLVVLQVAVSRMSRSHIEEWVMRPVSDGQWRAVTVRISSIGGH